MTRATSIGTLVALLATIAAGACRDDRVTLAVARDGGAGTGGSGGVAGGAGTGSAAGAGGSDSGGVDAGAGTGVAGAGMAGGGSGTSGAGSGGAGVACASPADAGIDGVPESDNAPAGAWVDRTPCVIPSGVPEPRGYSIVAFDADRRKLILYGGGFGMNDLWELDVPTATWTPRNDCGAMTPPPWDYDVFGALPQGVFDRARRRLLMFSGTDGVVWEWDPATNVWTKRAPAPGAIAPTGILPTVAYDETRGRALVFAYDMLASPPPYTNISLWVWDGATGAWSEPIPDGLPWTYSELPAVAYDAGRDALWMFGGSEIEQDDRLWRLDIATWKLTNLTPVPRPAAWPAWRGQARMAYDAGRDRLVLFGGYHDGQPRDLWELDPATMTWRNRTPLNTMISGSPTTDGVWWPPNSFSLGIFSDTASGHVVEIDGISYPQGLVDPVLWSWDGGAGKWSGRAPGRWRRRP